MNKFYIIVPVIMMAIFGFIYSDFTKKDAIRVEHEAAELKAIADAEAAEKAEAERQAKEDAARRTAEREADEARKIAERREKWEAVGQQIADSTAKYKAEADKFSAEAQDLEIQLLEIRGEREKVASEAFNLRKDVELARIAKRNAELQVQRMTEMVSKRAAESSLTKMPAAPAPGRR
ncbi:hypothetical protein [Synoicihabitans lomoniglobus]|uniref:Uncharacterized protein n=1 Tax=Synoicihabitans lomoniglobus TaxID=2909285 RepID=A0AAF0CQ85_9BACT|nr:hypothetical protein [Opitutaceae bacterium LMO-M01]WED66037.1 hypothetical protein PXH66_04135 [Opitutaceae bacterium LMO-M01]